MNAHFGIDECIFTSILTHGFIEIKIY